ncbi:MAG: hypothetical protein Edafosvirus2_87 [Edafosvirus sp.]|uniref:Uncharacterized protein n=1 Tax=Edafosvirus sp. TaxID=2487765 RepID=A0A3G4ZSP1_9VIRU|nr:MAG: hypothetical protein Edafosvirus2_87 [Edafosvirus sp.]
MNVTVIYKILNNIQMEWFYIGFNDINEIKIFLQKNKLYSIMNDYSILNKEYHLVVDDYVKLLNFIIKYPIIYEDEKQEDCVNIIGFHFMKGKIWTIVEGYDDITYLKAILLTYFKNICCLNYNSSKINREEQIYELKILDPHERNDEKKIIELFNKMKEQYNGKLEQTHICVDYCGPI